MTSTPLAEIFLQQMWRGLGGDENSMRNVQFSGNGDMRSAFAVGDFAAASIAAVGCATAELLATRNGNTPTLKIDQHLASLWFDMTVKPMGWTIPPAWDALAGDYQTKDGWIKLHTNAPHHKHAALAVLFPEGVPENIEKNAVAAVVLGWQADDLENAIISHGGCAAMMRTATEWADHPQGQSVAKEPLFSREETGKSLRSKWKPNAQHPLSGIRVLDLTRILAGPVATRLLAGLGAEVLRIDPPTWDEPSLAAEISLGKRCARLDLTSPNDRNVFVNLLAGADILVHGYRADALENLGLGAQFRQETCPGLIDISLNAYGWTGPWKHRRGFDSLVQMSSGIAARGMSHFNADKPTPLPVQALDHATGYLLAAMTIRALTHRTQTEKGTRARTSLARIAKLLASTMPENAANESITLEEKDFGTTLEATAWGQAKRISPPLAIDGVQLRWGFPAGPLGSSKVAWLAS